MENTFIIEAQDVSYAYEGERKKALDGLSLRIKKGQRIAMLGANGSGKSTFLLCCVGVCRPQGGKIFFRGKEIAYDKKSLLQLRSKVGIVFQEPDYQLFCGSVYQEISFGILNLGASLQQAQEEVDSVIERLGITPYCHKPTHALSGGQKKIVSIADIMVMHPEVIFLDEPAASLDPRHAQVVNHIVEEMTQAGITVIMTTHDVNYAYEWADEVILFHEGTVLMQGTPAEAFTNQEALQKTNLEMPVVLSVFTNLCNRGILSKNLPYPKNMSALEDYICSSIHKNL